MRVYVSFTTTFFWLLSNFLCGPLEQSCGRMLWVEGMTLGLFPVSSLNPLLAPLSHEHRFVFCPSVPSWPLLLENCCTAPSPPARLCPWYEGHHAPWWIPALSLVTTKEEGYVFTCRSRDLTLVSMPWPPPTPSTLDSLFAVKEGGRRVLGLGLCSLAW